MDKLINSSFELGDALLPRVTVVIPTFGRPDLVCRAIRSVINQTISDFEIIVVIDGNDPATVASLDAIRDKRLRWINHPEKRGAGQARDTGSSVASGEWVAFLDDDDEWLPEKLKEQLAIVPAGPAILMARSRVVSSYGTYIEPHTPYDNQIPIDEWLFDRSTWTKGGQGFIQTSSLMLPRALLRTLKFTDTKQHEEWELVIRAVKQHGCMLIAPEMPLVIYYVPEIQNSLSRSYTWRQSLIWAESLGSLLTRRAYSGFCLNTTARMAATFGTREAFVPICAAAFRNGAPTLKQIFAFLYFWGLSTHLRLRVRAFLQGQPASG